jgi:hypothetical protein
MRRITVTLNDRLAKRLRARALRNRQCFREVVNQALSLGLEAMDKPPQPARYRLKAASMGGVLTGANLDTALALASQLEDEAIKTES